MQKLEETEADLIRLSDESDGQLKDGSLSIEDFQRKRRGLELQRDLFKKNLARVEHDLFILNKSKYDLIKFTNFC